MSDLKPEERSWDSPEGEAAVAELKEGTERLRQHVRTYRAATAPKRQDEISESR